MRTDIKFAWARHTAVRDRFRIGVGADGSLWLPAAVLDLPDHALAVLKHKYGAVVLKGVDDKCIYVDTRAVMLSCPIPELREFLEQNLARFVKILTPVAFPDGSAGNSQNN